MTPPSRRAGRPAAAVGCAICRQALTRSSAGLLHRDADRSHPPLPVPLTSILTPDLLCDHCNDPQPRFTYGYGTAEALLVPDPASGRTATVLGNLGGALTACDACADAIEGNDQQTLLRRALAGHARRTGQPADRVVREALIALLHGRAQVRQPGRDLLTDHESAVVPTIRAAMLPKVRDRLATWWRSGTATNHRDLATPQQARDGTAIADGLDRAARYWVIPASPRSLRRPPRSCRR